MVRCRSTRRLRAEVVRRTKEETMNVLTLMVIIILAYWAIAIFAVSRTKDWD